MEYHKVEDIIYRQYEIEWKRLCMAVMKVQVMWMPKTGSQEIQDKAWVGRKGDPQGIVQETEIWQC